MWHNTFDGRLLEWKDLREVVKDLPLVDALIKIDEFWQQAPLVGHYLHIDDLENWPNPWDLLVDNIYCDLAKCLGICYTIILLERNDIKNLVIIETDNYFIVEVNKEHILNYYPHEIVTHDVLNDYNVRRQVDADVLQVK